MIIKNFNKLSKYPIISILEGSVITLKNSSMANFNFLLVYSDLFILLRIFLKSAKSLISDFLSISNNFRRFVNLITIGSFYLTNLLKTVWKPSLPSIVKLDS